MFKVDASPGAFLHGQRVPVPVPLATTLGAAPQPARYPVVAKSKKWLDQLMFVKSYSNYNSWAKPNHFTKRKIFAKWLGAMKSEYEKYDGDNLYELCK